jgi:hypothetical protein
MEVGALRYHLLGANFLTFIKTWVVDLLQSIHSKELITIGVIVKKIVNGRQEIIKCTIEALIQQLVTRGCIE